MKVLPTVVRRAAFVVLVAAACFGQLPDPHVGTLAAQSGTAPAADWQAALKRYCVTCHNERLKTAGLLLDSMDLSNVGEHAEQWEKVVRKLRTRAMPPSGAARPDQATYDTLIASLEGALDRAAESHPNPGRLTVHRLNRTEYTNAVRDLLALNIDARTLFPADDSGYGFDNIADVLSVSPLLFER